MKMISDSNDDNKTNLNRIKAEVMRYLKIQDSIPDGDSNTKYFHSFIKDKIRKLSIYKINKGTSEVS